MKTTINSLIEAQNRGILNDKPSCGNTTRMIDMIVQLLYEGWKVQVFDHFKDGLDKHANWELFDKLIRRLFREHPGQMKNNVKYDKETRTIEFI